MTHNNFESLAVNHFPKESGLYVVSTVLRTCSAALAYGVEYSETIVFFYSDSTQRLGDIAWQGEAMGGSLHRHNQVCAWLEKNPSMDGFDGA